MRVDFPAYAELHARARRERAEAIYRLLVVPAIRWFTAKPAPRAKSAPLHSRLA